MSTRRSSGGNDDNMLLIGIAAVSAFFLFKGNEKATPPGADPFANADAGGASQLANGASAVWQSYGSGSPSSFPAGTSVPDMAIDLANAKSSLVQSKIEGAKAFIDGAKDILLDIGIGAGKKVRIRKGSKKLMDGAVDAFEVDKEDVAGLLGAKSSAQAGSALLNAAKKSAKKGHIKKNGKGSRAAKHIVHHVKATHAHRTVKRRKPTKKQLEVLKTINFDAPFYTGF